MFKLEHLSDSLLKRFAREVSANDKLFSQGDMGNTMFIIIHGTVILTNTSAGIERLIGTLGEGEILGEKALCSEHPYRRTLSATAKVDSVVLEFDYKSIKVIQTKVPDFTAKMLTLVTERLDKANQLVGILQISEPNERLVEYIRYFMRHHVRKVPQGLHINITVENIHDVIQLDEKFAREALNDLERAKILVQSDGGYIVADENALIQYLPTMREKLAA